MDKNIVLRIKEADENIIKNLINMVDELEEESIHIFRTSFRKILALNSLIKERGIDTPLNITKEIFMKSGIVRDLQVQIIRAEKKQNMESFINFLKGKEIAAKLELKDCIRESNISEIQNEFFEKEKYVVLTFSKKNFIQIIIKKLDKMFSEFISLLQFMENDVEKIHEIRKKWKKIRYICEFFVEEFSISDESIAENKKIHDTLGELQDLSCTLKFIKEYNLNHKDKKIEKLKKEFEKEIKKQTETIMNMRDKWITNLLMLREKINNLKE